MWFPSIPICLALLLIMFPTRPSHSFHPYGGIHHISKLPNDLELQLVKTNPSNRTSITRVFSKKNYSDELLKSFAHFKVLLESHLHYTLSKDENKTSLSGGLKNFSNTCYFNSILQILKHLLEYSEPLARYPTEPDSIGSLMKKIFYKEFDTFTSPVKLDGHFSPLNGILLNILAKLKLDINHQEDSQEIFLNLLNAIDESLLNSKKSKKNESYEQRMQLPSSPFLIEVDEDFITFDTTQTATQEEIMEQQGKVFKNIKLYPSSPGKQEILSLMTKHKHTNFSKKKNYFFDLSLPMDDFKNSLDKSLQKFFSSELIENDTKPIVKNIYISKLPKILALHLKRFTFDPALYNMKKISDPLEVPLEISLDRFLENNSTICTNSSAKYSLSAVLVHKGNIHIGHYFSYVKVPVTVLFENQTRPYNYASAYLNSMGSLSMTELLSKVRYSSIVKPRYSDEDFPDKPRDYLWIRFNDAEVDIVTEEEVLDVAKGGLMSRGNSINSYMAFYTCEGPTC